MSGIRVANIPRVMREKELKIHFSKPDNGGGEISKIYFPLLDGDAVIIFNDEHTAETVSAYTHAIGEEELYVYRLPLVQAFPKLTAQIDETVTIVLQSSQKIHDEINIIGDLQYNYDKERNQATLTGNWYQLEWAWAKIDSFMDRQKRLQKCISDKLNRENEQCTALPKGDKPIKGDSENPLISMPNTPLDEGEDNTDSGEEGDLAGTCSSVEVSKYADRSETSAKKKSSQDSKLKSGHPVMVTASFKNTGQGKKQSAEEQGDQRSSLVTEERNPSQSMLKEGGNPKQSMEQNQKNLKATRIIHDKPDDFGSLEFEHRNIKVCIYTGEITLAETDVIVNAAMGPLVNAGGVARAIARAADPDMQRECKDYVRKHGSLPTSEVMHTCAGGSLSEHVKYVLHAVGPVWSSSSMQEACKFQLTRTFLNCFKYGNSKLKISSMTLPVISSGIFGCPLEVCVNAFVDAILLFTSEHEQQALHLKEIHLVNNSEDNTAVTVMQVRSLLKKDLNELTGQAEEFYRKMQDEEAGQRAPLRRESNRSKDQTRTKDDQPINPAVPHRQVEADGEKQTKAQTSGRPLPPVPDTDRDKKKQHRIIQY